jgi:hypothetical protein
LVLIIQLLSRIIDKISDPDAKTLQYEKWLTNVSDKMDVILKSPQFKGLAVSAASAGLFVFGANAGLAALGFGAAGIQAGSVAAAWMSSIGISLL